MIRTTHEAPFFSLWRDPRLLSELARVECLSTARYEPILRRQAGSGHIDLLFELGALCCVIAGIRLEPVQLITRERPALIWPAFIARTIDEAQLSDLEGAVVPWLRSIARSQPMASESIRRFAPSVRFERARAAGLPGAAPLEQSMIRMAPFVYARRFAAGASVRIACGDAALACAVLFDVAERIEVAPGAINDDGFENEWFGSAPLEAVSPSICDVAVVDGAPSFDAAVTVDLSLTPDRKSSAIDVPAPVPWDLLFAFDAADAPALSSFHVRAAEAPLRLATALPPARIVGGSSGKIVLALSAEAFMMRGADVEEAEAFGRRLAAEGFDVALVTQNHDPLLAAAQLVHIFGSPFEAHTIAFARTALERGIDFVFDLPPRAANPSALEENTFPTLYRAATDDADLKRYLAAYEEQRLDPVGLREPNAEDFARLERAFIELAPHAVAILAIEEDLEALRSVLSSTPASRIVARGVLAEEEPPAAAIGHLVPTAAFAFVHGTIGARSHALYAAVAAERCGIPLVIAGPVYDVDYLQTLRGSAPNAIVIADPSAAVTAALFRRAALLVDPAPRPPTAATLLRAVACGALPVLAAASPLARIAGPGAMVFPLHSIDGCAHILAQALAAGDSDERVASLRTRLLNRRDPAATYKAITSAYTRESTTA